MKTSTRSNTSQQDTQKTRTPYGITPWSYLLDHMRELNLPPLSVLLWGLIDQSCGKGQGCWKSHETLGQELGVSVATIKRYLATLDRAGLITIEARAGRTSVMRTINPARIETSPAKPVDIQGTQLTQVTQHLAHLGDLRELPLNKPPVETSNISIESNSSRFTSLVIKEINKRAGINLDPSHTVIKHLTDLARELEWFGPDGKDLGSPELIGEAVKNKLKPKQELGTIKNLEGYTVRSILPHITTADLNEARTRLKKYEAHKLELVRAGIA